MQDDMIILNGPERLHVEQSNGNYLVQFNGKTYKLDKSQYIAIKRKMNMPTSRLEVWLKSYSEEND